ncbi:MAG: tetratricopeptide repeat protein, partial [Polyangiales bacterium]
AAAAFEAGMQAFRDGSSTRAARSMKEAAKLDANLAAAYVRDALWEVLQRPLAAGSLDPEPGRALFKSAEVHRASALPYDRALIEAVEPRFRQQVDIDEAGRRLKALVDRHPKLAEPLYWLAMGRAEMGDVAGANAFIDRAMSVEPTMTPALLALRAWVERKSPSAAIAALDRCIALSPEATDCLGARARLRGFMGQCDGMEADAHAWVAADRDSSYAYFALAEALEARGAAVDGVRLALHSGEELAAADERTGIVEHNRFSLLMVQGDFASALKQAERLEETLPSGAAIAWRFLAVMEIADAALESDDRAAAGRAARRFLDRADAWTPKSAGDVAMPLAVLRLAFHTGAIESGELDRERARWMQKLQPMLTGQSESARRGAWLFAHAAMVSNAEEARAALAALPQFAPLSAPDDTTPGAARMIGRVHLLAGDRDAAVPYLRRAAGGCFILNSVAQSFGARVDLADALVSSGARDEARTLYQSVLARWGNAKPRSATADHVRAALAALGP